MRAKKQTEIFQNQIHDAVKEAVENYLNTPVETRHALEAQGNNLATLITSYILPVIDNIKIGSVLLIMEEGIGNMVMLTPAIKLLKTTNPSLKLTVWCKSPADEVIRGWDLVDKVITEFDNCYYDLCFYSIWSSNTKAQLEPVIKHYCKGVFEVQFKDIPEIIQQIALPEFFESGLDLPIPHCQITSDSTEQKFVDKIIDGNKFIVFGDTTLRNNIWDRKRWPHYKDLAELINKKFPEYKIYLIGDNKDLEEFKQTEWPSNVSLEFCGVINIQQLAYLLTMAEFYLGNDTGPSHIAAAVGTKTYVLFGPSKVSKNKPIGPDVHIITKNLWCSPCQYTERWAKCEDWICLSGITAKDVYEKIFFNNGSQQKKKALLVGDFSGGALRNEVYIKSTLEKAFKFKVTTFAYRDIRKTVANDVEMTYQLLNEIINQNPDYVLICGGQGIISNILYYVPYFCPDTKLINWYVDNRGQAEQWFQMLSAACDYSFWSTGDPKMLSQVFSKLQRPCFFAPIVPDDTKYYPIDVQKDIDVLFVGTPHSAERVELLEHLVKEGVKVSIYGNGDWPSSLQSYVKPGVFGDDFNTVLNRSKIILNINILNNVPLYFSDRYFYPMAVKTVGLNKYIPQLEEMFEDGKHMKFYASKEDCVEQIKTLLNNEELRKTISEEGYKLYKEKYTLKNILTEILGIVNGN